MKKSFIFPLALIALLLAGCANINGFNTEAAQAPEETPITIAPQNEPQSPLTTTPVEVSEPQTSSTPSIKDRTMDEFMIEFDESYAFDFGMLIEAAGLKCDKTQEGHLIISPTAVTDAESHFAIVIRFGGDYRIISGSVTYAGINKDGNWIERREFDSATDFIFPMIVGDNIYLVGADEMDHLYKEVKVLTAPAGEAEEVARQVDEELQSYYQ